MDSEQSKGKCLEVNNSLSFLLTGALYLTVLLNVWLNIWWGLDAIHRACGCDKNGIYFHPEHGLALPGFVGVRLHLSI